MSGTNKRRKQPGSGSGKRGGARKHGVRTARASRVTEASIERIALDLIGHVYDAALRPSEWSPFFERFADALGGTGAGIFAFDTSEQRIIFDKEVRVDPDHARIYREYYAQLDPFVRMLPTMSPGTAVSAISVLGHASFKKTEFYNDFVVRMGTGNICAIAVEHSSTISAFSSVVRPMGKPDFAEPELMLAGLVSSHLRRSIAIMQRLTESHQQNVAQGEVLDKSPHATILIDDRGRVVRLSSQAERIVARCDGVTVSKGRLGALAPSDNSTLQRLVGGAAQTALGKCLDGGGTVAVGRIGGKAPYVLLVTALRVDGHDLGRPRPVVAVFIGDPEAPVEHTRDTLMSVYKLTNAEARLALAIAAGEVLEDAARRFGVSFPTVRTQLRSIFAKTGLHRQVDLVRLVLALPGGSSKTITR